MYFYPRAHEGTTRPRFADLVLCEISIHMPARVRPWVKSRRESRKKLYFNPRAREGYDGSAAGLRLYAHFQSTGPRGARKNPK